jgi:hypothetical protein
LSIPPGISRKSSAVPLSSALSRRPHEGVEYELLDRGSADMGALFVLPERAWGGALETPAHRHNQVFSRPADTCWSTSTESETDGLSNTQG